MSGEHDILDLLTGKVRARRAPPLPPDPPAAIPPVDLTEINDTLSYLTIEPQERARIEAAALVDGERKARDIAEREQREARERVEQAERERLNATIHEANQALAIEREQLAKETSRRLSVETSNRNLRAELTATVDKHSIEMQGLRSILGDAQEEAAAAVASRDHARGQLKSLEQQIESERRRFNDELAKARSTTVVVPQETSPLKPEDIEFDYSRQANGLLRRITLRAKGYDSVTIDVERGADNRMRNLRVHS